MFRFLNAVPVYCATLLLTGWAVTGVRGEVQIIEHPQDQLRVPLLQENVTFSVTATGTGPLRYQWRLNGVNIEGATESTYTIDRVRPPHGGVYTVAVGNGATRSITSEPASLSLQLPAGTLPSSSNGVFAQAELLPSDLSIGRTHGENLEAIREDGEPFHAGKRGDRSIWYKWTPPILSRGGIVTFSTAGSNFDTLLAAYTGDSLETLVEIASNADAPDGFLTSRIQFNAFPGQTYYIAVDGFAGAHGEAVVTWEFEPTSDLLPTVVSKSRDRTVAAGERVVLEIVLEHNTDIGGVEWFHNNESTGVAGTTYVIGKASAEDVGAYTARVRTLGEREIVTGPIRLQIHADGNGNTDPDSRTFPKYLETTDWTLGTSPDSVTPQAMSSGGPSQGFTSYQIFNTYGSTKEQEEPNHCGQAGGASEWYGYQAPQDGWLNINTDGSNFRTVLAVYTGPGTGYDSLVEVACNVAPDDQTGAVVLFPAQQGTIYWIAVDGVDAATGTVHLSINLGDPVEILAHPESTAAILGTEATLSVEATGSPDLEYTWYRNGEAVPGATDPDYVIPAVAAEHAGDYSVTVSNLVNSVTSATATLDVHLPPEITAHPESRTVSAGGEIILSVSASGTPAPTYQWYLNGEPIPGATSSELTISDFSGLDEGVYHVEIGNAAGTVLSEPVTIMSDWPPRVLSLEFNTETLAIQFIVPAGANYVVESSTDLVNWAHVHSEFSENGYIHFSDNGGGTETSKFFRVVGSAD